jgi:hypothetical protein
MDKAISCVILIFLALPSLAAIFGLDPVKATLPLLGIILVAAYLEYRQ